MVVNSFQNTADTFCLVLALGTNGRRKRPRHPSSSTPAPTEPDICVSIEEQASLKRQYAEHMRDRKMTQLQGSQTNRLLGYPADARLLIINADDFGRSHACNAGILRSLTEGVVTSTTLMVPCPWALHAMQLLSDHPEIFFGIHLTVIRDVYLDRWGPLTSRDRVPSLIDEAGLFYRYERIPEFLAQVRLFELEVEFRAQIEAVLAAGLSPTHLDWHCLY